MRAVLYARVSTAPRRPKRGSAPERPEDQRRKDQDVESQLQALRPWAAARGWTVVAEHRDTISGDPARRRGDPPGLAAALEAIATRKADVLAVFSADRLIRSTVELIQLVGRVQSLGGHVASLQDGADMDTTTDTGELMVFVRGWVARMELKLIRARTRAGLERARRAGKVLGRPRVLSVEAIALAATLRASGMAWAGVQGHLDGAGHGRHPVARLAMAVGRLDGRYKRAA